MKTIFLMFFSTMIAFTGCAQNNKTVHIWPGKVPGENDQKHEAETAADTSRNVTRLTNVTDPVFQVSLPEPSKSNRAGIVICPGGGYNILAINLEGYEIANWLNQLGYATFVLQYRVPQKQAGALQDVQRAIRMMRSNADKYHIKPDKIGILGFSAGGSLSARASTLFNEKTYQPVDKMDSASCRPDFTLLIYPAYLDQGPNRSLTPELKVSADTPPMFIFATADDKYSNSTLVMAGALRDAHIPVELHLYPKGGHGYGLRTGNPAAEAWPPLAEKWLKKTVFEKP